MTNKATKFGRLNSAKRKIETELTSLSGAFFESEVEGGAYDQRVNRLSNQLNVINSKIRQRVGS